MLIMELVVLNASRNDLVSDIRVFPACAFIRKSPTAPHVADFSLKSLCNKRGIELVGARNPNIRGIARVLAERVIDSTRRRLQRLSRRTASDGKT
jgi:hypothetical protein